MVVPPQPGRRRLRRGGAPRWPAPRVRRHLRLCGGQAPTAAPCAGVCGLRSEHLQARIHARRCAGGDAGHRRQTGSIHLRVFLRARCGGGGEAGVDDRALDAAVESEGAAASRRGAHAHARQLSSAFCLFFSTRCCHRRSRAPAPTRFTTMSVRILAAPSLPESSLRRLGGCSLGTRASRRQPRRTKRVLREVSLCAAASHRRQQFVGAQLAIDKHDLHRQQSPVQRRCCKRPVDGRMLQRAPAAAIMRRLPPPFSSLVVLATRRRRG